MLDAAIRSAIQRLPKGILAFRFGALMKEMRLFPQVARGKLPPAALKRLEYLGEALGPLANADEARRVQWGTADQPIETNPSAGSHQIRRGGHGRNLKGIVDFRWEIQPIGRRQRVPENRFLALWNSSVRIHLVDTGAADDDREEVVASWNFDVGDNQSPGCHFHAKFSHPKEEDRILLEDVDVPRLPCFIFMPTDAIEFVIGELWQDDWRKIAASGAKEMDMWRQFSRRRFEKLFAWYSSELGNTRGTPWAHLKCAKPDASVLLEEK
jgi:hypothetical protein